MMLSACKVVYYDPRFKVYLTEVSRLEVPLVKALTSNPFSEGMGSEEFRDRWGFVLGSERGDYRDSAPNYPTVTVKPPGITVSKLAILGHTIHGMVKFLISHSFEVSGNGDAPGDSLVSVLRVARAKDPDLLLNKLVDEGWFDSVDALSILKEGKGDDFLLHSTNGTKWFLPTSTNALACFEPVFYLEVFQEMEGFKVPRSCLAFMKRDSPFFGGRESSFVVWDSNQWRYVASIGEFLDRYGDTFENSIAYRNFLYAAGALSHYQAKAVLRLPPQKEAAEILEKGVAEPPSSLPPFGCLVDSRSPVHIPSDTPVIDQPKDALAVLARTVGINYVGETSPAMGGSRMIGRLDPNRETWLVLAVPSLRI